MADITRDEMQIKWMGVGEQLGPNELNYMTSNNIEPGFNDHSSRAVLDAFRAGYTHGTLDEAQRNIS